MISCGRTAPSCAAAQWIVAGDNWSTSPSPISTTTSCFSTLLIGIINQYLFFLIIYLCNVETHSNYYICDGFPYIFNRSRHLKRLTLAYYKCMNVSLLSLSEAVRRLPELEELHLVSCMYYCCSGTLDHCC